MKYRSKFHSIVETLVFEYSRSIKNIKNIINDVIENACSPWLYNNLIRGRHLHKRPNFKRCINMNIKVLINANYAALGDYFVNRLR